MRRALARGRPPAGAPPANWGDPAAIVALLGRYGQVEVTEHHLAHDEARPEEIWERWERLHPMWIAAREQLEPDQWADLRTASIAALRDSAMGAGAESPFLLARLERH